MIEQERSFVAVRWGDPVVLAVCVSASIRLTEYAFFLNELVAFTRRLRARPSLVVRDFSAYATVWGFRGTNWRVVLQ